jgi:hypothetical protein
VYSAFQALRERATTRLVPSPRLERVARPVVRGNVVVPEEHLRLRGFPDGIRYLRSVDLLALLELATRHDDAGAVYAHYARQFGPVPLPDVLGGLSVLVAKGGADFA